MSLRMTWNRSGALTVILYAVLTPRVACWRVTVGAFGADAPSSPGIVAWATGARIAVAVSAVASVVRAVIGAPSLVGRPARPVRRGKAPTANACRTPR